MSSTLSAPPTIRTLADLLTELGNVSPERIRARPAPGTATEQDVIEIEQRENRLCELVDGVLVEKIMGYKESVVAAAIVTALRTFVIPRKLGLVSGEAGMMRLFAGLVRIPDVAFVSWERVPGRRIPLQPIPQLAPDLVVEVLSEGNTTGEMERKRREYFNAGVRTVWMVDPEARTVVAYTTSEQSVLLRESETLDGGDVLPGFTLPLREIFSELDAQPNS